MLSEYIKLFNNWGESEQVLILVLMEYALWAGWQKSACPSDGWGLNPCFNGICSLRRGRQRLYIEDEIVLILVLMEYALWVLSLTFYIQQEQCLNPCFNGICSLRRRTCYFKWHRLGVLILVLMEYALWDEKDVYMGLQHWVLILVLMEYALWAEVRIFREKLKDGLNPCFNGICSLRDLHSAINAA